MKTIKCAQVGGDSCPFEVQAETAEEAKQKLGEHAKVAHAEMMAASTEEDIKKWNDNFDNEVWPKTADNE